MKKILSTFIVFLFIFVVYVVGYSNKKSNLSTDVVEINKTELLSHNWDSAYFAIECVESLYADKEHNLYGAVYDDPDAFEEVITLSMTKHTYNAIKRLQNMLKDSTYNDSLYWNTYESHNFRILYSNCNEVLLMCN